MKKPKDVDEYIASIPEEIRGKLIELRNAIKTTAPQAEEKISYGMPYYGYKGRLVYFRLATHHIGLYIPMPVVQQHIKDLKGYDAKGATVRFPLDKKLPITLIKKLVNARVKINEEATKKK